MNATSYRALTALFAVLPLCAAGLANLPPEPQGYRMEDYRAPTPATLRGALAIDTSAATKLDGTFALHPSLAETAKLYAAQQAAAFHLPPAKLGQHPAAHPRNAAPSLATPPCHIAPATTHHPPDKPSPSPHPAPGDHTAHTRKTQSLP